MTENKLKKMEENNKFDELINNKQELERLSKIKDISEVLDVLNKYGYNGTKQDLGRDLFEILQGLSEDDLKNISGGKILNKKYLAGLMGGLTMMGAMGLTTSAQVENQSTVITNFFNKVNKKVLSVAVASFVGGGIFVKTLDLMFRGKQNMFQLNKDEQKIYDKTKVFSDAMLKCVENYIKKHKNMPDADLDEENPEHHEILSLIKDIRSDWIKMYVESKTTISEPSKQKILDNKNAGLMLGRENTLNGYVGTVKINLKSLESLFYFLPIDGTFMGPECSAMDETKCPESLPLVEKLWCLENEYRIAFAALEKRCEQTSDSKTETDK